MINQISHVLRPGGLIDITEFPFYFSGPNKQPIIFPAGTFEPPWLALWMSYAMRAIKGRGADADAALHIHNWISTNPAFEDVVLRNIWLPVSPFLEGNDPETIFWNEVAVTMRDDLKVSLTGTINLRGVLNVFLGISKIGPPAPPGLWSVRGICRCDGAQSVSRTR